MEDAAKIDGCGFWRIYWFVMLPLIKPTLVAIAIFTFTGVWNDFMGPLMMAGSLMLTLPVIFIIFFAQKYIIQGVTLTGMKG